MASIPPDHPANGTTEEVIAWADRWVQDRVPSTRVLELSASEHDHFAQFNREFGRFVAQYEAQFTVLADLIEAVNYLDKGHWPPHRAIQYVLLASNGRGFYSAFDRLARGYYEDSITLTRGLYETFVRTLFVSCHQDAAYSVLVKPNPGTKTFNLTNFLDHDLGLDWQAKYSVMSNIAHSNKGEVLAALERALKREGPPEAFGLQIAFQERLAVPAVAFLNFTLLAHLRVAFEVLAMNVEPASRLHADAVDAIALLQATLVTNDKEYWRTAGADLDLLLQMVSVADNGDDWKTWLADRRSEPPHEA